MEGIIAMERVTGISLSESAKSAYASGTFMSRNNLWTPEDWAELESRKLEGMQHQSVLD